jgi:hypothetical protein
MANNSWKTSNELSWPATLARLMLFIGAALVIVLFAGCSVPWIGPEVRVTIVEQELAAPQCGQIDQSKPAAVAGPAIEPEKPATVPAAGTVAETELNPAEVAGSGMETAAVPGPVIPGDFNFEPSRGPEEPGPAAPVEQEHAVPAKRHFIGTLMFSFGVAIIFGLAALYYHERFHPKKGPAPNGPSSPPGSPSPPPAPAGTAAPGPVGATAVGNPVAAAG